MQVGLVVYYDRSALPDSLTILAAGVGEHMVGVAGECADGFVGHTNRLGRLPA
jgi:hypothetical protein